MASARNAITSLWKVADKGAARFFEIFYRALWQDEKSVQDAFELAQRRARKERLGHEVWSAFVLYGSGAAK